MMKARNFDVIVGTALCDYSSIPHPDNGYKCLPCRKGYFTPELRGQRCLPCEFISDYYGVLNSKQKERMLLVCGDLANSGTYNFNYAMLGLGLGISFFIVTVGCCVYLINKRRYL